MGSSQFSPFAPSGGENDRTRCTEGRATDQATSAAAPPLGDRLSRSGGTMPCSAQARWARRVLWPGMASFNPPRRASGHGELQSVPPLANLQPHMASLRSGGTASSASTQLASPQPVASSRSGVVKSSFPRQSPFLKSSVSTQPPQEPDVERKIRLKKEGKKEKVQRE